MIRTPTVDSKTDMFAMGAQAARVAIAVSDRSSCDQDARVRSDVQIYRVLRFTVKRFCRNLFALDCRFSYVFRAASDGW
eukprot:4261949-Pleurochrysis_carterae.AAC.1